MNKKMVIISIIVLLLDQLSKLLIEVNNIHIIIIKNFLNFDYYQNSGAAWSILEGKSFLLIIISLIMLILIYSMSFSYNRNKLNNLSFGLLFGGIIGNLVDRVFYGFVRDFISFKFGSYNFPVFNIADMAIVIGVGLLIISTIKGEKKDENKSRGKRKLNKNR